MADHTPAAWSSNATRKHDDVLEPGAQGRRGNRLQRATRVERKGG